jgi:hypothetical protein
MAAERADIDMAVVSSAHGERTVIGLYYAIAVIAIPETEYSPFDATALSRRLASQRAIETLAFSFPQPSTWKTPRVGRAPRNVKFSVGRLRTY